MPHKNAIKQLSDHGKLALKVDKLITAIYDASYPNGTAEELQRLVKLHQKEDLQPLTQRLATDKYAYNRELAVLIIRYLWQYVDFMPCRDLEEHLSKERVYINSLNWTFPLLEKLAGDTAEGPLELAIGTVTRVIYHDLTVQNKFRSQVLRRMKDQRATIRLAAVKSLQYLYEKDHEHILDKIALKAMIEATYYEDEDVRDWACFNFATQLNNTGPDIEKAVRDAFHREHPSSDVYTEAVMALARQNPDDPEAMKVICEQLTDNNFADVWLDEDLVDRSSVYRSTIERFINATSLSILKVLE